MKQKALIAVAMVLGWSDAANAESWRKVITHDNDSASYINEETLEQTDTGLWKFDMKQETFDGIVRYSVNLNCADRTYMLGDGSITAATGEGMKFSAETAFRPIAASKQWEAFRALVCKTKD